ncbi:MAG: aldose epimerase family protein [Cyclobacteriaceae bacterium]
MSNTISPSDLKTYTLQNEAGAKLTMTNYGAKVMSLWMPDKKGVLADVVLGYDTPEEYLEGKKYFGAVIGRYGNRIANGKFQLDGHEYQLAKNNGPNSLHGGPGGFHNVLWQVEPLEVKDGQALVFTYESADGEEGFPGKLSVKMTYTLTNKNSFVIDYEAVTTKPTIVNLTHHSFFNLAGEGVGDILDHELMIQADSITEVDDTLIPTGKLIPVGGTPFDFRKAKPIREHIHEKDLQMKIANGYDHNWVLKKKETYAKAAVVKEPVSGRVMEVWTTEPGLQFYSSNNLNDTIKGKGGKTYPYRSALCLEAQHFPDSPNHSDFPSTTLRPGNKYIQRTAYRFRVD